MAILPTPELEAAILYRQTRLAKVAAKRDAKTAYAEADHRANLRRLEAEHRAVTRECVA
ncbi:hypothetical protein QFZ79_002920 [Arthrobacter sp. V4I6]|uniref:hypothetical protein n=1 Tax=Arthrobacter sp. V4I6 TaxID=3042281 RepID=UPI00278B3D14|nr:hypothetical protein [Arthrobacter sp. V4I6]MDQ0854809.1 hypothetical protein [Arthrobacter sp. V4I6]